MKRASLPFAFVIGLALGLPATARSGGDPCAPFGGDHIHYDQLTLRLDALTVDGIDQPVGAWADGAYSVASGRDDEHVSGVMPDPASPSSQRVVYGERSQ